MKNIIVPFCFLCTLSSFLFSQELEKLPAFGVVTPYEAQLTSIAEAPDETAVVLFDVKEMEVTDDFNFKFKYRWRMKVLKPQAKELANARIVFDGDDRFYGFHAQTILKNGTKVPVARKEIFEEKQRVNKAKVFAFPSVDVGSILEYEFEIQSENLHFARPWYFQSDHYSLLSRLSLLLPPGFKYSSFALNILPEKVKPVEEIRLTTDGYNVKKFTWQLTNIQAFKTEPFMSSTRDFWMALYFQLSSYKDATVDYTFVKTWDDMAEFLSDFYKPFADARQLEAVKKLASQKTAGLLNDVEKKQVLFSFVRDSIQTQEDIDYVPTQFPAELIKTRSGSAADKNMFFLTLLKAAGIDAKPCLISTSDNGKFRETWVQLHQFNQLLVCIADSGSYEFFDTADPFTPQYLLPSNDITEYGLLILKEKGKIVTIPAPLSLNMKAVKCTAELHVDGSLSCQAALRYEDYSAAAMRQRLSQESLQKIAESLLEKKYSNFQIDTCFVENQKSLEIPLVFHLHFSVPEFGQRNGDIIYFTPSFLFSLDENPFTTEKRNFPVDYHYHRVYSEEINLKVPPELEIVELPPPQSINSRALRFMEQCKLDSTGLNLLRYFMLKKVVYPPAEYIQLRNEYTSVFDADRMQIVLKRKP